MSIERTAGTNRGRLSSFGLVGALIAGTLVAGALSAQARSQPRGALNPDKVIAPIQYVRAGVDDMSTRDNIGWLPKGEGMEIAVGQTVRLRMQAVPRNENRPAHYPSTRFTPNEGQRNLAIEKINPEVGSIIVRGLRPHEGPGATVIFYEILEKDWPIPPDQMSGRVYLRVVEDQPTVPQPSPVPAPAPAGVTVYEDANYRGGSEVFVQGDRSLRDNAIGNDRISSVRVPPGCAVYLYSDENFSGAESVIEYDAPTLSGTRVGNDSVSSLDIRCGAAVAAGAVLFERDGFLGRSQSFPPGDYPDLRDSEIGNDRARSVRVAPGCRVQLYADAGFRGRSMVADRDLGSLTREPVGGGEVSSLRVFCQGR